MCRKQCGYLFISLLIVCFCFFVFFSFFFFRFFSFSSLFFFFFFFFPFFFFFFCILRSSTVKYYYNPWVTCLTLCLWHQSKTTYLHFTISLFSVVCLKSDYVYSCFEEFIRLWFLKINPLRFKTEGISFFVIYVTFLSFFNSFVRPFIRLCASFCTV